MVDAQVLLRDRRLTTLDEEAIQRDGFALRYQIVERLRRAGIWPISTDAGSAKSATSNGLIRRATFL